MTGGLGRLENGTLTKHTNSQVPKQNSFSANNHNHQSEPINKFNHLNGIVNSQKISSLLKEKEKQIEELLLEKIAILDQLQELKNSTELFSIENQEWKSKAQHLEDQLHVETHSRKLLEEEIQALYKQFNVLKKSLETQKEAFISQQAATQLALNSFQQAQLENQELRNSFNHYHDELALIKEHLTKGQRDAKEMEKLYAEAIAEKVQTLKALHQQRREYSKQHEELIDVKEKFAILQERERSERFLFDEKIAFLSHRLKALETDLKSCIKEREALFEKIDLLTFQNDLHLSENAELEEIKTSLEREKIERNVDLQHLQEQLEESNQLITILQATNEQLQHETISLTAQNNEKQFTLDEAHQHLAKKVRESALLNEKVEEFILREVEAGNVHAALQQANQVLQSDLQTKEKKIKELAEKVSILENEILRWDEKWRQSNQSKQILEEKIQDLEKIEQRHLQLQNFLIDFGATSNKEPIQRHSPLQFGVPLEEVEGKETRKEEDRDNSNPYPNLFDIPQMKMTLKQTLFD